MIWRNVLKSLVAWLIWTAKSKERGCWPYLTQVLWDSYMKRCVLTWDSTRRTGQDLWLMICFTLSALHAKSANSYFLDFNSVSRLEMRFTNTLANYVSWKKPGTIHRNLAKNSLTSRRMLKASSQKWPYLSLMKTLKDLIRKCHQCSWMIGRIKIP